MVSRLGIAARRWAPPGSSRSVGSGTKTGNEVRGPLPGAGDAEVPGKPLGPGFPGFLPLWEVLNPSLLVSMSYLLRLQVPRAEPRRLVLAVGCL